MDALPKVLRYELPQLGAVPHESAISALFRELVHFGVQFLFWLLPVIFFLYEKSAYVLKKITLDKLKRKM